MAHFDLHHALEHARHYLPAQNPLERFVHHNTLHAFESHSFHDALAIAGQLFGTASYMAESQYRACLGTGRITDDDLRSVLEEGIEAEEVLPGITRRHLADLALRHGVTTDDDAAVAFELSEGTALEKLCPGISASARSRLLRGGASERDVVRALYAAAESAWAAVVAAGAPAPQEGTERPVRRTATEDLRRAKLIRWSGAYLDCGVAEWTQPDRSRGFFEGFRQMAMAHGTVGSNLLTLAGNVARGAPTESAEECVLRCLTALDVPDDERANYVRATLLELPGWAGMFARAEDRPDQLPGGDAPSAKLLDFLAVALLLKTATRDIERAERAEAATPAPAPSTLVSVYRLFRLAQLLGLDAAALSALSPAEVTSLFRAWDANTATVRLRLFHEAYERNYRERVLDQVAAHLAQLPPAPSGPSTLRARAVAQVICCIDDREESLRRHLEAIDPEMETYAAAGFFGVAMAYQGFREHETFPLCPPVVTPRHKVREVLAEGERESRRVSVLPQLAKNSLSHTLVRGALVALGGAVSFAPMSAGVLAPRLLARATGERQRHTTRLELLRTSEALSDGLLVGFSHEEMANIVYGLLAPMGVFDKLAPLVLMLGHGSHSVNNPQSAAYNCGACAGGHGGPNGRAFAQMANTPEVRALLVERFGAHIPEDTWFVGGNHDTADEAITLYDTDLLPETHEEVLKRLVASLDRARILDAEERCKTFASGVGKKGVAALRHVQARAEDLAQPRPELGHARNAACVVGRRAWSRGLDLDRRAFLVSYNPNADTGKLLDGLLGAVVPVCAGISLEYYFSFVDPQRYGAGTKLPHNLTGLLGVMDGHASDLRTGLPWQMVEVHEPVRLLFVVEATPARLKEVMAANPVVARLIENEWVQMALIHPVDRSQYVFRRGVFERRIPHTPSLAVAS